MQSKIDYIKQALKEQKTIISFTGMHGCGKSTMLDKLSEVLEIPKLIEPCRLLLPALKEDCLSINDFQSMSFMFYCRAYITKFDSVSGVLKSSFICDRIAGDILAYWRLTLDANYIGALVENINKFSGSNSEKFTYFYDIVIRLKELPVDETKERRDFTQEQEDQLRINLQEELDNINYTSYIKFLDINSNNFDERFSMIIDYLYKYFGGE